MNRFKMLALSALFSAGLPVAQAAVPVTADNFIRAESDRYFGLTVARGGFGKFAHWRNPIPVDRPTVIRPNRDTLYSSAVFDLQAGPVSVTMPDAGERFMSLVVIDENHNILDVHYGAGEYRFDPSQAATRYVLLGVRTLVNPSVPGDLEKIWALQDAIVVKQPNGPGTFEIPQWDEASREQIRKTLFALGATLPDSRGMFGKPGAVDPVRHLIGSAMAWGGNPEKDTFYQVVYPQNNDGRTTYRLQVPTVPTEAFWSISVYDDQGQFRKNAQEAYSLNNLSAQKADDGTVSVQFGGCTAQVVNCLPTMPGWNYMVRYYKPGQAILDGSWKLPEAKPAS